MNADARYLQIGECAGGVEFSVKVVPGSSRNQIVGIWDTSLRLAVTAPPEGGKANKHVIRLVAEALGVKRGAVEIVQGRAQPVKRLRVGGLTPDELRRKLAAIIDASG